MPVTVTACGTVPPVSRTTEPVTACRSLAVVGASTISSGRGRHPPVGEHDRDPLAAHRVVREALHRDPAGLRAGDPRVVDAGDVRIGGHGLQDLAGGPEVLAAD